MFIKFSEALASIKTRREENEKGFTLIELLVVVLIIGILSAIAIPIFLNQQAAARDSAVQSDITNLKVAIVSAIVSDPNGAFPTIASLTEFTQGADSDIDLTGDSSAFCIEGFSTTNEGSNPGSANRYAASDTSGTIPGSCTATFTVDPASP